SGRRVDRRRADRPGRAGTAKRARRRRRRTDAVLARAGGGAVRRSRDAPAGLPPRRLERDAVLPEVDSWRDGRARPSQWAQLPRGLAAMCPNGHGDRLAPPPGLPVKQTRRLTKRKRQQQATTQLHPLELATLVEASAAPAAREPASSDAETIEMVPL